MIISIPKPESISWNQVSELLHKAHKSNLQYGFVMKTIQISSEELKRNADKGQCFVALNENGDLVGTASVCMDYGKGKWYDGFEKVAFYKYGGIDPCFQGQGIMRKLNQSRLDFVSMCGVEIVKSGTHENNERQKKTFYKEGFVAVDYLTSRSANYYSVIFVKWLKKMPYPLWYCNFRFRWARFWTRFRYKPGKIERFRTIAFATRVIAKLKNMIKR